MNFTNEIDMIQFFANEYISPGNKVLVLGLCNPEIKQIIEFINAEAFCVSNQPGLHIDIIADYDDLPFEEKSFDTIINFTQITNLNFFNFLKEGGVTLVNENILNAKEYYHSSSTNLSYHLNQNVFSVI